MPTVPLLSVAPALPASRPSALPSRWHFKAGTQTWQARLSACSQTPSHPPTHTSFLLVLSRPLPILPRYPHRLPQHLKDTAPTPAGPGQRQDLHRSPPREPLSKKLFPTSLINNGPFLMQTLWICNQFPSDPIGEFRGLDRRQTRRGGLVGDASKSLEFRWLGFTCIILCAL